MSIELSGGDGHTAIQAYLSTLPLLDSFESLTRPTPSYISQDPSPSKGKFDSHQEVYRYLSTALSRAAVLSARTTDVTRTLRILRTYHSFSSSWPHSFRPVQRQRLLLLYLRALQAGYPAPNTACATPYLVDIGSSQAPGRQVWKKEVLEAFKQGQQLLSSTTTFPRAGTLNLPVRRFTESCVALADIHSPFAKEVVAILYWAMTLTFQSQSLLRHLTRLLAVSGSYADAKRNFELYVKIVLKDRETKQPEISLQLKRRPTVGEAAHPDEIARQAQEAEDESGPAAEEKKSQFAEAESDTTTEFISTLLVGSRLLVKNLAEVEEAWRYAGLAGKMISVTDQRKEHVARDLRAEVEACKGIVRMALAMSSEMPGMPTLFEKDGADQSDVDASNRAEYQSQAIDLLTTATLLSPKSSKAQYHLAYCLAEARQIEPAISAIRTCLELDQQNVQAWHLLALLLSASKDWEGATKACEAGIRIWEDDEENDAAESEESPTGNPDENEPTIGTKDFASPTPTVTQPTETISAAPIILRSGAIRSPAPLSPAPPTRSKKLENVIRLRITYKTIIEKTQGAEPAMEEAENLFAFFSERSGSGRSNFGYRRGLSGVMNQSMISVKDTGGSYVSVADLQNAMLENPGHRTSMLSGRSPVF
jgi:tetratricopeptide (TPR) repeat protein